MGSTEAVLSQSICVMTSPPCLHYKILPPPWAVYVITVTPAQYHRSTAMLFKRCILHCWFRITSTVRASNFET